MKHAKFNSQSGKSIIEVLIVLVVGGILIAMAVVRMTNAQSNLQRQNFAREFKVNLERARFDAVKRRAVDLAEMARVTINSATSYTVLTDVDQNGTLNTYEARTFSFPARTNVKILGTNLVFPVTIRFDRFGNTTTINNNGDAVTPLFTFCEGTGCTLETANVTNSNVISLSATGTVAMLNGGDTIPTFGNPTVTNVSTGTSINTWVVVREDNATPQPTPTIIATPTATPTPTPTISPSATPTVSPTASPTASATPTPTATATPTATPTPQPTATPVYCTSGQRPSSGCTCKLPMTVRSNGKCQ